ncbi:MAG: M3 family metallopeptidase [Rikenellaceae bacterium]|nr:M3 family metallopeptidase [Rikenellaceae bacterium]
MKKTILVAALVVVVAAAATLYFTTHKKPKNMENPFFTTWDTPFGVPPFDEMLPEHFEPALLEGMSCQMAEIDTIKLNTAAPTFDNTVLALDRSGEFYGQVSRVFDLLTSAETNDSLEAIKTRMSPLEAAHSDAIVMDTVLFAKIKSVYDRRTEMGLDEAQTRLLERTYKRFVRNGALLSAADKAELKEINGQLASLGVRFGANRREAINAYQLVLDPDQAIGLPSGVIAAARARATEAGQKGKLLFTLQKPSWIPFLTYSDNQELRRQIYQAYQELCAEGSEFDNTQIINDIVKLRTRKAHLLGYPTYADFVLDERMAKTPARAYSLLDDIWTPAIAKAIEEREAMRAEKIADTKGDSLTTLEAWDWWHYAEKVRKSLYNFDEEKARPYLSVENVRQGIFQLCNRLYGITFRPIKVPVYHKDVSAYEVLDADNSHLAVLYLDFHPRAGKSAGAWCGSYRSQGYNAEGERISPIVTIVCNFTEPVAGSDTPALLTLDETETFFHEFGHALHNFFADVPYKGLLGTERDFVELPSQIMENWAFEPIFLKQYALHYRSGDPMPDDIVERMQASSLFNQGFNTVELVAASLSDMDVHSLAEYAPFNVADFETYSLTTKRGLIPQIAPRYHYPYFSHIFDGGYAAGYYGYIWAEVLDKDAYQAFVESGDIFNKKVAADFRHKVLARRGLRDGMELYVDFRGHEPSREPLFVARGLIERPAVVDTLATPTPAPIPDSLLREILGEGPLEEI